MARIGDRLEELDKEVRTWGNVTRRALIQRLMTLDLEERTRMVADDPQLLKNIRRIVRKKSGDLEGVAFSFPRHGIFLEHGVGKNRPKGSAAAFNAAKPWLKPVLPDAVDELADLLEQKYADLVAADLRILIPGIIDTNIKGNKDKLPDFIETQDGVKVLIDPSFF